MKNPRRSPPHTAQSISAATEHKLKLLVYSQKFRTTTSQKDLQVALRRAMCMLFALGIPWSFGYLMLVAQDPTSKEIFSFLFSVFNSLQVGESSDPQNSQVRLSTIVRTKVHFLGVILVLSVNENSTANNKRNQQ